MGPPVQAKGHTDPMDVFLLQHVAHFLASDEEPGEHRDDTGDVTFEPGRDDFKVLGVFTSRASAQRAIERARSLPGFQDEPNCFIVDEYTLDELEWATGFIRVPAGE